MVELCSATGSATVKYKINYKLKLQITMLPCYRTVVYIVTFLTFAVYVLIL